MANWFEVAGLGFQEFSAGGVRTFAVVEGRTTGFPLVLLHGTPGASFIWSTTVQAIGRSRRIIAPDLPGWGRSFNRVNPQPLALTRNGLRGWLNEVIAAQQIEQFDLVGIGDGALLALDLMFDRPERVRRLGLLNLPLKFKTIRKMRLLWRKPDWQRNKLRDWLVKESGLSASHRELVRPMFEELLSGGWHPASSPLFPTGEFRAEIVNYRDALQKFPGESLLGWGANSVGFDTELAAGFAQRKEIVIWQEAANFPMWEQPEPYQTEMIEFLST